MTTEMLCQGKVNKGTQVTLQWGFTESMLVDISNHLSALCKTSLSKSTSVPTW
jgi:hypothetical protein